MLREDASRLLEIWNEDFVADLINCEFGGRRSGAGVEMEEDERRIWEAIRDSHKLFLYGANITS